MGQNAEEQVYAEARRVLRALLMGVDPETQTRLSAECVVMRPEVVKALALGTEALQDTRWVRRWRDKLAKQRETPVNGRRTQTLSLRACEDREHAGEGWSKQEDVRLTSAFYQNKPVRAIAAAHGRTDGAIESRLVKLGLIRNRRELRTSAGVG